MNETSKHLKKILIIPFILGLIVLIGGIAMVISGINKYSEAKENYQAKLAQYEIDYDKWYDKWWNDHTATLNDQPKHPGFEPNFPGIGVVGIVLTIFSIPCILAGLSPLFVRKTYDKSQDYMDSQNSQSNTTNILDMFIDREKSHICTYCGSTIDASRSKCDSCGARIKK